MTMPTANAPFEHSHVFLGSDHDSNERRTWAVIILCVAMMGLEIVGGAIYGSIALMADGLHMSTHAGALLLTALAYRYARRHAFDRRFTFGTGKVGDLAGYTSAVILAMIALLIAYEAVMRLLAPVPIDYGQAIAIAVLGLAVNIASVWLLNGGAHHHHHHAHGHGHDHGDHHHHEEARRLSTASGSLELSIFEDGVPPRFRLRSLQGPMPEAATVSLEIIRKEGTRQRFIFTDHDTYLESQEEIPEPHAFAVRLDLGGERLTTAFAEPHTHGGHHDNNMRSAIAHVMADAAVSVLVIVGLLLGLLAGWGWMDPIAGLVGAAVILSWSYTLIRDTGGILVDMLPDRRLADAMRRTIEEEGDKVADLHLWRLGPGHLGAILSIASAHPREPDFYRGKLAMFPSLSHVTIEVQPR
ncbi:CDF family Co(II)/Ni(II) efflux transporter DmeF [Labrys sp. WJW]|uniref:CDF family Co(II)/Ni(II) efflux transporter DmeF n=1 Tax=Labrys sp. WJW TaxID=1737983 RepID=UPI0009EDDE49|nr:CDF family Co(II)/Ni(II) efflux transporter DmeF [Labrys sp. WJW]